MLEPVKLIVKIVYISLLQGVCTLFEHLSTILLEVISRSLKIVGAALRQTINDTSIGGMRILGT